MSGTFIEQAHVEPLINAVADFAAGDVGSDIVNMKDHNRIVFIAHWGVGATGVVKFTVQACSTLTATATTAIPFRYRQITAEAAPGAVTDATASTGVSNSAASNQVYLIEVTAAAVNATGYQFVRLYCDETTDDPLLGGVMALLLEPRHAENETSAID